MLAACLASSRLVVARGWLPHVAACYHVSLSVRGRESFQKPPEAITAAFSVRQELQWGCRGLATGTQPSEQFENVIVPLLRVFFTRYGHCEVPDGYKVTAEHLAAAGLSTSDCKIGFGLDKSLLQIETQGAYDIEARTDRQALLDAIDCDWAGEWRFERIVMALQWFKASEGHMEVPNNLVLDNAQCAEAGMPEHVKEFRLGQVVNDIRSQGHFVHVAARRRQLDSIRCIWDAHQHQFDHHVLPALQWFKASEGHMEVPEKLVLDEAQCREARLPEHVTEFRLGQTVNDIRHKGDFVQTEDPSRQAQYAANTEKLDSTNFIWDALQHRFDSYIKPAVSWFKVSEGHAKVPQKLVLDEAQCCEAGLPEHIKEFRLGQTVKNIRRYGVFVQTADPSREAQCAANKGWLEAHLDNGWLWAKLP